MKFFYNDRASAQRRGEYERSLMKSSSRSTLYKEGRNLMSRLSFTMENYLEAIFELSGDSGGARLTDIAHKMGVTKASANSAISTLAAKNLVDYEPYREISLTPRGLFIAKNTSAKHQVIKKFLRSVLHVESDVADRDACAIEHVISCDSINAMLEFMGSENFSCSDD